MLVWAAYLLPSRRIGAAIRDAARRAEAEIMLGERSDVPVSRWASERLFTRFLRAGLRIHCYRPQIVHAKALVLDDVVYVGSSNLDVRSLLINYELLLRIPSAALAARLRAEFESDRRHADTLDLLRWRRGRRHHVLRSRLQSTDSKIRTSITTSSMRTANAHDRAQRRAAHAYCRPAGSLQRQTCQEAGT
jgi:phosphatidylserine/phosphatidylglycerophosphate/cardiolipin synthase-like enzyme